ncbi:phosphoadenosine phosphosulfate reductase family protein [Streptomyces sp. NPDC087440]|uniref:phosphoadenosine phosphosulfate reductase domain-containing protein n=1 Tax=Streptomyces sp. NPDC087440 TaxID=3365790 RepID=UPI00381F29A7
MPKRPSTPPCAAACGTDQRDLVASPPAPAPTAAPAGASPTGPGRTAEFDFDAHDVVVALTSGGKDSGALVHEVCTQADAAGQLHKVRVLHCDLGTTAEEQLVEWPGAEDIARAHAALYAALYDVPFAVRRSARWPSLWERMMSHGRWPGHWATYCRSDTKTAAGRDYVDEVGRELNLGRPPRAGYAMGMRAEESRARAKKPVLEVHRMTGKGTLRRVTTWLPVHHLTTAQVWDTHQHHGIPHHEAYDLGMRRLSCRACPLAGAKDLVRSAQLNPALFAEYAAAEPAMGQFKPSISLAQIIERARS